MLFFLRKLVEALLLPIGISMLLVIAGMVFRRRWLAFTGVATLYIFSIPITARLLMRPLEQIYPLKTVAASSPADAVVVLSGSIVRGIAPPGVQWGDSANRYFAGLDLAMAQKAKFIVFSAAASGDGFSTQGEILRQAAIRQGITPDRIIVTGRVLTTDDEAREVSHIPGIHSVLLVTSAYHMDRAALLFRSQGLNVLPFPTDQIVLGRRLVPSHAWIPAAPSLQLSELALREYYGLAVYHSIFFFRPRRLQRH